MNQSRQLFSSIFPEGATCDSSASFFEHDVFERIVIGPERTNSLACKVDLLLVGGRCCFLVVSECVLEASRVAGVREEWDTVRRELVVYDAKPRLGRGRRGGEWRLHCAELCGPAARGTCRRGQARLT